MNEQRKWEIIKEKITRYKKSSSDKSRSKKLFSDLINTFITTYHKNDLNPGGSGR